MENPDVWVVTAQTVVNEVNARGAEELHNGESVISHDGLYETVRACYNGYTNEEHFKLDHQGCSPDELKVPSHQEWHPAAQEYRTTWYTESRAALQLFVDRTYGSDWKRDRMPHMMYQEQGSHTFQYKKLAINRVGLGNGAT